MEDVLNIPGSIHSISQEGNAVYADEVFDKRKNKKQQLVNQETDEALEAQNQRVATLEEAVGEGGSVDERIAQSKSEAESDIKGGASSDYDTLKKTEDAIKAEVNAREGAVSDEASARQDAINTAKTEIIGGASTDCNTLGKAETKISTNAQDIAQLQAAYEALTESDVVVVAPTDTWPVAAPQQNTIYRVADRVNTPPQNYSDYMYNGTAMVLMATYNNAIDPRPKKGSQNLVSSGGVFDNMGALDVSELNATENPHTLATYADLSAALAAIPSDYQKGGMSIKFVQSSDNKYVQYRLTADEWSIDTEDWAIADEGIYVENPEFVRVVTDNEDRILYAVKADGDFYFGAGVPQQIIDYVIEHTNATKEELLTLIDTKVDKEEGKSLIDAEDKILEGITTEGKKQINIPIDTPSTAIEHIENHEWLQVTTDSNGRILEGRKTDGNKVEYADVEYPNGIPSDIKGYIKEYFDNIDLESSNPIIRVGDNMNFESFIEAYIFARNYKRTHSFVKSVSLEIYGHIIEERTQECEFFSESINIYGKTENATIEFKGDYNGKGIVFRDTVTYGNSYGECKDVRFLRTGEFDGYDKPCCTIHADNMLFENCIFENQTTSPVPYNPADEENTNNINVHGDRRHGCQIEPPSYGKDCNLVLINCTAIGSPYGFKNTRGFYMYHGTPRLYGCIGIGGGIGKYGYGFVLHRQCNGLLYDCIGYGSQNGWRLNNGIVAQSNNCCELYHCKGIAGSGYKYISNGGKDIVNSGLLSGESHGMASRSNSSPKFFDCVGYAGDGDGSSSLWFDSGSFPIVKGGFFGKEMLYSTKNFQLDEGEDYCSLDVNNKNRDIDIYVFYFECWNMGTQFNNCTLQLLVDNDVIYQTTQINQENAIYLGNSSRIEENKTIKVKVVDNATGIGKNVTSTAVTIRYKVANDMCCMGIEGFARPLISGVLFEGNKESDGIRLINATGSYSVCDCQFVIESTKKAIISNTAISNVRVFNCIFGSDITENVNSYASALAIDDSSNIKI